MSGQAAPVTVLAFDYGRRRIGVAVGNRLTGTASPAGLVVQSPQLPWSEVDRLIEEWGPGQLVVGLPGGAGPDSIDEEALMFVQALRDRYKLAVATVDETLTSRAAHAQLSQSRRRGERSRRVVKGDIDKAAACLIAEQWMKEAGRKTAQ